MLCFSTPPCSCVSFPLDLTEQLTLSPAATTVPGVPPDTAVTAAALLANSISEAEKGILGWGHGPKNAEGQDQSRRGGRGRGGAHGEDSIWSGQSVQAGGDMRTGTETKWLAWEWQLKPEAMPALPPMLQ
ncbi:hypothetical protein CLOM_g14373 [Closterium sp. NIES-68]|nr:hypothetical protein CLOM_g14373 [Closterium sp. NIES-68]GJP84237.1 hypothetical protein CLOP_g14323 [Closterium sp. NIES-67]